MTTIHPAIAALSAAIDDASGRLRVPAESIRVEEVQAREWPDSCLGLPADDEVCTEALTPGYRIRLGDGFVYHADQHGTVRQARRSDPYPDTELRLRYSVSGGIAGRSTSFETDSWMLSDTEEQELRDLVEAADFFAIRNPMPQSPVNDGYTYRLWIAVGRREHEVVRGDGIQVEDSEALQNLFAWAHDRTPPLFPEASTIAD